MIKDLTNKVSSFSGVIALYSSSFIKLNYMFGTLFSFFSATQIISPLFGLYGGMWGSIGLFTLRTVVYGLTHGLSWNILLLHHAPTLVASLYLSNKNVFFRIIPSLLCIFLFIAHPVGQCAAIYSLFWLIPISISLFGNIHFFGQALGATMSAHAVGSVIFLYTRSTSPELWYSLLPIVPCERFVIAGGITITFVCIQTLVMISKNILSKVHNKLHDKYA